MAKRAINSNMYEYNVVDFLNASILTTALNTLAKEGWEPLFPVVTAMGRYIVMRRLVVDDPGSEGSPLEGVARG